MKDIFCKVCGMIINDKNYDFNRRAILEKNNKSEYIYCPFCGASHKYFVGDRDEIINLKEEKVSDETKKILIKAAKLEVFNGDFYKIASEKAKNKILKEMFKGLCNIEYTHARIHKKFAGMEEDIQLKEIDYDSLDSDEKLLKASEERECHAVAFYTNNLEFVIEKEIREIFEAFIRVEKDHINITKEKYKQ